MQSDSESRIRQPSQSWMQTKGTIQGRTSAHRKFDVYDQKDTIELYVVSYLESLMLKENDCISIIVQD